MEKVMDIIFLMNKMRFFLPNGYAAGVRLGGEAV